MAMHLASMVHDSRRDGDMHERLFSQPHAHHRSPFFPPQQPPKSSPSTSSATSAGHYPTQPQRSAVNYPYHRPPQSPPSPPAEEQKPLLPSISSLLGIADGEQVNSETAGQSPDPQRQQQQRSQPQLQPERPGQQGQQPDHRGLQTSQAPSASSASGPRMHLPPTPPMHPHPTVDGNSSPSAASNHSNSGPFYLGQALNNMEPHHQRQDTVKVPPMKRDTLSAQTSMSPYSSSSYAQSPYTSSPGAASSSSFYSPETHSYNALGVYGQRPLPSSYQTQTMPLPAAPASNGSNPWQHHHYIGTSSQSAFPQSQDRYICTTCNKAFSRPSSLRIHSHSHTGEKPYKCPQHGCGKAFSVRSNMKRHERGCHASTSAASR